MHSVVGSMTSSTSSMLQPFDHAPWEDPGGGGYSGQFRIGVCRQGSQTLTLFKGRKSRIDTLLKAQNQEMAPYLRETR